MVAIVHRADRSALRFIKMSHAFRAAIVRDDINVVAHALTITHVIAFAFGVASSFKDSFVGAFR